MGPLTKRYDNRALPSCRPRGFTLIEIIVVIVVIGVAAGLVVATIGRDDRAVTAREAKRFAGTLEYLAARAQWRAETLGVTAQGRVLRYWKREPDGDRWSLIADDDVLAARVLPEPLTTAPLTFAGQPVSVDAIVPMRPSGRNEPLSFVLQSPEWRAVLAMDPLNRVSIDGPYALVP